MVILLLNRNAHIVTMADPSPPDVPSEVMPRPEGESAKEFAPKNGAQYKQVKEGGGATFRDYGTYIYGW